MLLQTTPVQTAGNTATILYGIFALLGIVAVAALAWGVWRYNAGGATIKALQDLTDAQEKVNAQIKGELTDARQQISDLTTEVKVLQKQVSGADAVIRMEKAMHEQHVKLTQEIAALTAAVNKLVKA